MFKGAIYMKYQRVSWSCSWPDGGLLRKESCSH